MDEVERWVGVDWGSEHHQVCVIDAKRKVLWERSVPHTGQGLHDLVDALLDGCDSARVVVGIETPRGAVVETLVERGVRVFSINPKQLDRFRDRHTAAGAKDDRRDAFVLADSLRTDAAAFRQVSIGDPQLIELRELTRLHEDLVEERGALGNRLGDQLRRYFPQILSLGSVYIDLWLWALLDVAPSPARAKKLTVAKVTGILRKHRVRRLTAESVLEVLAAKPLTVAAGVTEAAVMHITALIARLRLVHEQDRECDASIERLLLAMSESPRDKAEHRDARVILSLPGVGAFVGATILVEAHQALQARDYRTLRALSGVAPVTRATGKRSGIHASVSMRRACNSRLRNAVHYWVLASLSRDPCAKEMYGAMRARGHTNGRAIRGVADRLLAILVAMLKAGALYDPDRRRGAQPASAEPSRNAMPDDGAVRGLAAQELGSGPRLEATDDAAVSPNQAALEVEGRDDVTATATATATRRAPRPTRRPSTGGAEPRGSMTPPAPIRPCRAELGQRRAARAS
jgi:transposase